MQLIYVYGLATVYDYYFTLFLLLKVNLFSVD